MFCPNCGSQVPEDAAFCPQCGARPENENSNEKNNAVAADTAAEITAEASSVQDTPAQDGTSSTLSLEKPGVARKKKRLKKPVAIGASSAGTLLLAGIIAFVISPVFRNNVCKAFLSPDQYFRYVVKTAASEGAKDISNMVDLVNQSGTKLESLAVKGTVSMEFGDKLYEVASENVGPEAGMVLRYIESVSYTCDVAGSEKGLSGDYAINLNGKEITNVGVALDAENERLFYSIPDLNPKALCLDFGKGSNAEMDKIMGTIEEFIKIMPDEKALEKITTRYATAAVKAIGDIEETKETLEIEDVSQKVTTLTVEIDEELVADVLVAVLDEVPGDKEMEKIVKDCASLEIFKDEEKNADEIYEDFLDEVEDLKDDIDPDELGNIDVELSLYINNSGDIIGFTADVGPADVTLVSLEKGNKYASEFSIKAGSQGFTIEGSGTKSGNKMTGEYTVGAGKTKILGIDYENVDADKLKDGNFVGNATISVRDGISGLLSMAGQSEAAKVISSAKIKIESKDTSASMGFYLGDDMLFKVNADIKENKGGKVKIPSDYVVVDGPEDLEAWVENFDETYFDKILSRLKDAGIPGLIVDRLEDSTVGAPVEESISPSLTSEEIRSYVEKQNGVDMEEISKFINENPELLEQLEKIQP